MCFELGEGGAPEAEQKRILDLYTDYCTTRDDLGNMDSMQNFWTLNQIMWRTTSSLQMEKKQYKH